MSYRYGFVVDNENWIPKERASLYRGRELRPAILKLLPLEEAQLYDQLPNCFIGAPPMLPPLRNADRLLHLPRGAPLPQPHGHPLSGQHIRRPAPFEMQAPDGSIHRFHGAGPSRLLGPPPLEYQQVARPYLMPPRLPLIGRKVQAVRDFPVGLHLGPHVPGFVPEPPHDDLYPEQNPAAHAIVPPPQGALNLGENMQLEDDKNQQAGDTDDEEEDGDHDDEMDGQEGDDERSDDEEEEEDPEEDPEEFQEEEPGIMDMARDGDSEITSDSSPGHSSVGSSGGNSE